MKRLFSIAFISTGFLAYLFFDNYTGQLIPYPTLWLILSLVLALIGVLLWASDNSTKEKKLRRQSQEKIARLKQQGEIIEVDLTACEIISNNYYKSIPKNNTYEAQVWNSFYIGGPIPKKFINQSRLIFKPEKSPTKEVYVSPIIHKDDITLNFLLHKIGKTKIYADRKDKTQFYFDLEFLTSV